MMDDQEPAPLMFMDGFDDAILGVLDLGDQPVIAYSLEKVLANLVAQGMTPDEAREYHLFNQAGSFVGPATPVFIRELEL